MEIVKGSIAIMGSGETSPALVSVHRKFVEMLDNKVNAFLIDTPFGFQENADVLVDKLQLFFKKSVQIEIKLASLRNTNNIDSAKGLAESLLLGQADNKNVNNNIIILFENILSKEENYPLALWVVAEHEIILNNYKRAKKLLNRLLIQLSEDSEEYNLVLNKIKEINN